MRGDTKTVVVATVTAAACIVFTMTLARAGLYAHEQEIPPNQIQGSTSTPTKDLARGELPDRLKIPSLGINTHIQHVGIGKSGNMAVPTNYSDVGWYRYGVAPGQRGSAVIDGHLDNGFGMDAVFKNITEMQPGDIITVVNGNGEETNFIVEEVQSYDTDEVPLARVFNQNDKARLNLITCGGDWDGEAESYERRVVVYAVLV